MRDARGGVRARAAGADEVRDQQGELQVGERRRGRWPSRTVGVAAVLVIAAILSGCANATAPGVPSSSGGSAPPAPRGECSFAPGAPNPCTDAAPVPAGTPELEGDWLGLYQSGAASGVHERTARSGQSQRLSVGDGGGYLDITGPARLDSVSTASGNLAPASGHELMAIGLALIGSEPGPPLTSIALTGGGRTVSVPVGTPFPSGWQRLGGPIDYPLLFTTRRAPGELRLLFTVPAGTRTMRVMASNGRIAQIELP